MNDAIWGMLRDLNKPPGELNPLLLAYLGDAVYEVFIRNHLVAQGISRPQELQKKAVAYVSASAQAKAYRAIEPLLTENERDILRRGRNAKSGSVPKNAKISDYRHSTGLEALIGYLYCLGDQNRLHQIMAQIIERVEKEKDINE